MGPNPGMGPILIWFPMKIGTYLWSVDFLVGFKLLFLKCLTKRKHLLLVFCNTSHFDLINVPRPVARINTGLSFIETTKIFFVYFLFCGQLFRIYFDKHDVETCSSVPCIFIDVLHSSHKRRGENNTKTMRILTGQEAS